MAYNVESEVMRATTSYAEKIVKRGEMVPFPDFAAHFVYPDNEVADEESEEECERVPSAFAVQKNGNLYEYRRGEGFYIFNMYREKSTRGRRAFVDNVRIIERRMVNFERTGFLKIIDAELEPTTEAERELIEYAQENHDYLAARHR